MWLINRLRIKTGVWYRSLFIILFNKVLLFTKYAYLFKHGFVRSKTCSTLPMKSSLDFLINIVFFFLPRSIPALFIICLTTTLSIACFTMGLFFHIYKPTKLILDDRLTMRQIMPYYRWWKDTDDVLVWVAAFIIIIAIMLLK